jgi:ferredoxin-NADP reductase
VKKTRHTVVEVLDLTPGTFILRLDRKSFQFKAGQYVILRPPDHKQGREYSIYSGMADTYLDFLIREIPGGRFSGYLRNLTPGSEIDVEGPAGFFIPGQSTMHGVPAVFIATGTGISPFHSYVRSYPDLNYTVLHGVKFTGEAYGRDAFKPGKLIVCSSQDNNGNYRGRVTEYMNNSSIDKDAVYYLCGNATMIDDVNTVLEHSGVKPENIRSEVFF